MTPDQRIDSAFRPVVDAIEAGRIPGAVLGLVDAAGNRALRVAGSACLMPHKRAMDADTWFDLASLTKVLFTTPRIIALHEQGALNLNDPLITVLPDLHQYHPGSWIRQVSFAQCLSHQTAFPAVEPLYTYGRDPDLLRAFVLQRNWTRGPAVYSDINFILLGIALERILGCRIRAMDPGAGFAFHASQGNCAATEFCTWRERIMCGEVHDDNCHALQGAGHAGLFGTAGAVLDHARQLLAERDADSTALRLMRTPVSATRTMGWECKHENWPGGSACSDSTIGHTGFTGTGLWVDFDNQLAWTLLSNRIHPSRHTDSGIVALRRTVGEAIFST